MAKTLQLNAQCMTTFWLKCCWCWGLLLLSGTIGLHFLVRYTLPIQTLTVLGVFWLAMLISLMASGWRQHLMQQNAYQLLQFNQNLTGVWLQDYGWHVRQQYVAFEWLQVTETSRTVVLRYQHALRFKNHKHVQVQAGHTLTLRRDWFDAAEWQNFMTTLTFLQAGGTGQPPKLQPVPAATPVKRRFGVKAQLMTLLSGTLVIILGTIGLMKINYQHLNTSNAYHQRVDYQKGKQIHTRQLIFQMNHAYHTTSSDGTPLVILNITTTPLSDEASIGNYDFNLYRKWTALDEMSNNTSGEPFNPGVQVRLKHQVKPVINQLDNGYYTDENQLEATTFNLVFKRPRQQTFDLVYAGFDYLKQKPSAHENTSFVLHFNNAELEALQ